jgi:tRNA threonylcarbamoyladenosine biosynthesis protein TsaB
MRSASTILLALDTSSRTVGLALYDGVQVLHETIWITQDYHTVELAPAVEEAFKKTSLRMEGLGALAVALGPGSFTGLRVGLALAKGLAAARHVPIIGIPTLDSLAASQPRLSLPMAAVLRAGRGRLAVGWYRAKNDVWQATDKIEVLTPEDLMLRLHEPTLVCGELNQQERGLLLRAPTNAILASPAQGLRRPSYLAELAWRRWQKGKTDDAASLAPIYLHYHEPIPG